MSDTSTKQVDFSKLRFVRIFDPIHIPKELIEQVRDRDYTVDKFIEYQKMICLTQSPNGVVINPLNLLFVVVDDQNIVKGFLWAVVAPLSSDLVINTFSMNKAYWCKGEAVKFLADFVKQFMKDSKLNKAYWVTNCPKHSMRYGFKPSKSVLMEYQEEKDGINILRQRCETSGDCGVNDPGAASISGKHIEYNTAVCDRDSPSGDDALQPAANA